MLGAPLGKELGGRAARVITWANMRFWLLVSAALVGGCASSALTRAALQSDLPELRKQLQVARDRGELDAELVNDLAHAVARRELTSSQGDAAVARVRELQTCLRPLLNDVVSRADDDPGPGGAAAALALLEAGYRDDAKDWAERFASSPDPMWRSVAARAYTRPAFMSRRAAFFVDGDLRVRRSALHAALEAPNPDELDAVLEAARLDPDPLTRSLAIRVVGKLQDPRGLATLRDLWTGADEATQQQIVDAWASARTPEGQAAVEWVLATQRGLPRIVAAARSPGGAATAVLTQAIEGGSSDEQRLALRLGLAVAGSRPPELVEAAKKVLASADPLVRVAAAEALLSSEHAQAARDVLHELAKSKSVQVVRAVRRALVQAHDASIAGDISRDLTSSDAESRATAAEQLVALGKTVEAAAPLADDVASVRTRVACSILARE